MRVWLYARLSNDDDREMNSLLNQREICQAFAEQHGDTIVGQSFDDNINGMSFDRRGLDELTAAVDADKIDAVIVKDLSRLGRHRTQTALFIDYLREIRMNVIHQILDKCGADTVFRKVFNLFHIGKYVSKPIPHLPCAVYRIIYGICQLHY